MAQQPNIELEIEELPRPEPHPGPARPWTPGRPGDVTSPADVPRGGLFGIPGPDAGYALRLLETVEVPLAAGEERADTEAALAAIIMARAGRNGRGPTRVDVDVALALLGLRPRDLPAETVEAFAAYRKRRFGGFAHDPERVKLWEATLPDELVFGDLERVAAAVAGGPDVLTS